LKPERAHRIGCGNPALYCADVNCQLSPQAAERLDRLGYTKVFDYKAGKADWQKAKLQVESS
jgi:hypothetical protein